MKTAILAAAVVSGLLAVSCSNPCDKLAKAVCDKTKDAKTCESFKQKMKTGDKKQCQEQLKNVDKVVADLQGEKVKDAFKDLGADLAKQVLGGAKAPPSAPAGTK